MKTNTTLPASASSAAENPVFGHMTSVMSQQDNWPAWLSNDLNKIESKEVWQISFKTCWASVLQFVAVKKLTKEFSFYAFPLKSCFLFCFCFNEARKQQWQMAMNRWDIATKKWEPKHHDVLCSKHKKKSFTDRTLLSIQFGLKYMSTG